MTKRRLFTSESVSAGHPDKVADQISDAILDAFLSRDRDSKVACEVLCTTGLVVISGEVRSSIYVDVQKVARHVIRDIGYDRSELGFDCHSCGIISTLHGQSPDIAKGVVRDDPDAQGAGDQGIMFGYACNETPEFMPLPIDLCNRLLLLLDEVRISGSKFMPYLRPDAKCQFTVEYEGRKAVRVHTLVLSVQHDDFYSDEKKMHERIEADVRDWLLPQFLKTLPQEIAALFDDSLILHVNPTGNFVIGGPNGDTGLTGRKIIVDTYGGRAAHGGGAFSGKDASKVDRSAAYAARYIAKNLVAAGLADEVQIQLGYAIGVARPVSICVDTFGTAKCGLSDEEIAEKISTIFDLRPAKIIERLGLKYPIYELTAAYGHFGKAQFTHEVALLEDGKIVHREVQFFGWERLDAVDDIKAAFRL